MSDKDSFSLMYSGKHVDVTRELLKTAPSSKSTRREYMRMREEEHLRRKHSDATAISTVTKEQTLRRTGSSDTKHDVNKIQSEEPHVTVFPFKDTVNGNVKQKHQTALEADEHPGHKHGAKLCMVSAVIHMKCIQQRRAKSIRELKKRPTTTLAERKRPVKLEELDDSDDETVHEPLSYLNKCRYIRGAQLDRELTIDEIFG